MSQTGFVDSSIVAVYPDHPAAEHAVRQLHQAGFALGDLSIVGRDFQTSEEPVGFVSAGDYAKAGAKTGAWFGGLFGLVVGAAFLVLPGVGPSWSPARSRRRWWRRSGRGAGGNGTGQPGGALVGWGVPRDRALKYETQVKGGKFLVIVRGKPEVIARARNLLAPHEPEHIDVYDPAAH